MAKIKVNEQGDFDKQKRWHKRRKPELLPANFDTKTQAEQIEILRGIVIVQARLIESLLGDAT